MQGTDQPCRAQGHEELGLYAEQGSTLENSKWENNEAYLEKDPVLAAGRGEARRSREAPWELRRGRGALSIH